MIELLRHIKEVSRCRDREAVVRRVVAAIFDLVSPQAVMLFHVGSAANGPRLIPVLRHSAAGTEYFEKDDDPSDIADAGVPLESMPLLQQAYRDGWSESLHMGKGVAAWAMQPTASGLARSLLMVESEHLLDAVETESIACFLAFFGNYLDLLDYSELDTLTGLNNRKTYDEAFDRILASIPAEAPPPDGQERRHESPGSKGFWLGVIDIDHFKRVNDTFGHLFGDEVLLRVANLMKHCFRASDKLFRFGGEEFVVLLRPNTLSNAEHAFQRFRQAVETHEFPQVGKVTCSIGFTRIDPVLPASNTLGQADAALYFSKDHGRNQVNCYESLLAEGLLATNVVEAAQPDFDIDALFS